MFVYRLLQSDREPQNSISLYVRNHITKHFYVVNHHFLRYFALSPAKHRMSVNTYFTLTSQEPIIMNKIL